MADARVDILLALKSKIEDGERALGFLGSLTKSLTAAGLAYAAFNTAKASGQLASELKNQAAEANLTTDALQILKLGAMGYGVAQETIVRGAIALRKNLEDAAKDGASPLRQHLEALKLTAVGLQTLAPERQFEAIGRAIAFAADKEAAFAAGMELLGAKSAPKLLEFLRDLGVDGFDKIGQAAKGLVLTKEELESLDRAANYWERIGYAMKIAGARATNAVIAAASPAVSPLASAQQAVWEAEKAAGGSSPSALSLAQLTGARLDYAATAMLHGDRANVEAARAELQKVTQADLANTWLSQSQRDLKTKFDEYYANLEQQQAKHLQTVADMNKAASDAELKATLAGLEVSSRATQQRLDSFTQKGLSEGIDRVRKAVAQQDEQLEKDADKFKNVADPLRVYKEQLRQIVLLKTRDLLTDQEAAAATKAVTQAMLERSGEIGNHTRRLSELQEQRRLIEGDPFISAEQRQSRLAKLLTEENAELDKQINLLRAREQLTPDQARQLDDLVKRRTDNQYNPAGFSFGQQVGADVMAYANSFGTQAQQVAGVITNTIGRAVDGVSRGIAGWVMGTTSWAQVLQQIGTSILEEVIGALVRIGVQQLINATVGKTLQATALAATLATTAATSVAISSMMIAPATLATIASFGGAAAAAPAEILAALAATAPLGLFYAGGHTGPGGIVHADEWVAPSWMVNDPVFGGVIDSLETARSSGGTIAPAASAGSPGGDNRPERTIVIVDSMNSARALERDPEWNSVIVRAGRRNRGDFSS